MDMVWALVLLILVCALVWGAYALGRASAFAELRRGGRSQDTSRPQTPEEQAPVPSVRPSPPRTATTPPVLAGGEGSPQDSSVRRRGGATPPAAAAGPTDPSAASLPSTPKRTATPPPAAAAWSTPKLGSDGKRS